VHVTDGRGHDTVLGIMEALVGGGLSFAGFVDNEGRWNDSWKALGERLGALLFRWADGDVESNIIAALEDDQLEQLLIHPFDVDRTRDRLLSLAERLGIVEKDFASIQDAAGAGLRQLIMDAAHGLVPEGKKDDEDKKKYKSHARRWFKSLDGGRELESKVFCLGLWPKLQGRLLPFCNGVRAAIGMKELDTLPS
jgi:putative ATP-dependent endonuclease of the OLD family